MTRTDWNEKLSVQVLPPSIPLDQEENDGDLSLASPPLDLGNTQDVSSYSTGENPFDLSLSHLHLNENENEETKDDSVDEGPGDLSFDQEKLEREYGSGDGEEELKSPPPMVLEEVEEGPGGDLGEEKKE